MGHYQTGGLGKGARKTTLTEDCIARRPESDVHGVLSLGTGPAYRKVWLVHGQSSVLSGVTVPLLPRVRPSAH